MGEFPADGEMLMAKKVLAFDFGASSGRAMLGEYEDGKLSYREIHRFPNEPVECNGHLYWDVLRLFHEIKQGILKAKEYGFDSIGIDTWGVDYALLDKRGDLIGNPIHYRDARTGQMIEKAAKLVPQKEMYESTGLQFMYFNTAFQMLAEKEEHSKWSMRIPSYSCRITWGIS